MPRKKLKDLAGLGLGLEPGLEAEDLAVRVPDRWAIGTRSGGVGVGVGCQNSKKKSEFGFARNGPKWPPEAPRAIFFLPGGLLSANKTWGCILGKPTLFGFSKKSCLSRPRDPSNQVPGENPSSREQFS